MAYEAEEVLSSQEIFYYLQLTGLEVKEKIIYSFALGKQISLE